MKIEKNFILDNEKITVEFLVVNRETPKKNELIKYFVSKKIKIKADFELTNFIDLLTIYIKYKNIKNYFGIVGLLFVDEAKKYAKKLNKNIEIISVDNNDIIEIYETDNLIKKIEKFIDQKMTKERINEEIYFLKKELIETEIRKTIEKTYKKFNIKTIKI